MKDSQMQYKRIYELFVYMFMNITVYELIVESSFKSLYVCESLWICLGLFWDFPAMHQFTN